MRIGFSHCNAYDWVSEPVKSTPSYRRRPVSGGFRCDGGIPAFAGMTGKTCLMTEKICRLSAVIVALFIAMPAFADPTPLDRKTVSSKAYVDTSVETRQQKIPAAGTNSANAGTAVVMYTTTGNGTIGERQIYDGTNNYTSGDANKLVTASALKGSVTNLPTMETSKLTCANPDTCSLWTIEDQQVYGGNNNNSSSSNNNNNNNG